MIVAASLLASCPTCGAPREEPCTDALGNWREVPHSRRCWLGGREVRKVPCISLTQPWASIMALGAKRYESRGWATAYRGPLVIAASKGFPLRCRELCKSEPFCNVLRSGGIETWRDLPRGRLLCVVELVGCEPTVDEYTLPLKGDRGERLRQLAPPASNELAFGDFRWRGDDQQKRYAFLTKDVRRFVMPFAAALCATEGCGTIAGERGKACINCGQVIDDSARAAGALGLWHLPLAVLEGHPFEERP